MNCRLWQDRVREAWWSWMHSLVAIPLSLPLLVRSRTVSVSALKEAFSML